MSANKILLKHGVITKGNAGYRVVLDRDAGLGYAYHEPEKILAIFEKGRGWIVTQKPYYNQGGWGNSSSGDALGYHLGQNIRDLLRSVDATILELNSEEFFTVKQARELNRVIAKHNRLVKKQKDLVKNVTNRNLNIETLSPVKKFSLSLCQKGKTLKGIDAVKTAKAFEKALETFINQKGKVVKAADYTIKTDIVTQLDKTVAFRDAKGQVFLNSEMLKISSFESAFLGGQSVIQSKIREISKFSIPFNVLESASLKLNETKVLEQGPEGDFEVKTSNNSYSSNTENRHFTGALLLENHGRKFLMDIDRKEIKNKLFNAFFVEVDGKVTSIEQAYDSMTPLEVKTSIKAGLKVERQGEWFFIPTNETITVKEDKVLSWDRDQKETKVILRHNLAHGKGRPNSLYKPVGFGALDKLVCGTVSHSGREHADLDLGQKTNTDGTITFKLWQVIPNTTVSNFTITGDID